MKDRDLILNKIKPSRIEEISLMFRVNRFLKRLNKNLWDAEAILGGSVAKGTFLKGQHDVDIFVLYKNDKDISNKLESSLRIFKNIERVKGSRDYFQARVYGLNFEIVPVLKIKTVKEAKNITDISPLHVDWVKKNAKGKILDEIRLAKVFCKAQDVYGAESYIKGFSGYVIEILTIYSGGFEKLIKNAVNWKYKQVIDISKHYKKINKSKESALLVIDPLDPGRNAAAALSEDKFKRFKAACKGYLNNPNNNFFERKDITLKYLEDKDTVLRIKPLEGRKDIIGAKLLKTLELIKSKLEDEGYNVAEANWHWGKTALFWFKVKNKELPPFKKHYGPPVIKKENVLGFKARWEGYNINEEDGKLYVNVPREYKNLGEFILHVIKLEDVLANVKEIRIMK